MNAIDTKICASDAADKTKRRYSSLIFDKNSFISSLKNQVSAHEATQSHQKSVNGDFIYYSNWFVMTIIFNLDYILFSGLDLTINLFPLFDKFSDFAAIPFRPQQRHGFLVIFS
jgi:hypothetical protein